MDLTAKINELLFLSALGYMGMLFISASRSRPWAKNIYYEHVRFKNQTLIFAAFFGLVVAIFGFTVGFRFEGANIFITILLLTLQIIEVVPFFLLGVAFCREAGFEPLSGSLFDKKVLLQVVILAIVVLGIEMLASKFVINPALSILQNGAFADPFSKLLGYQPASYKVFLLILIGVIAEESIFRLGILGAIFYKANNKNLAVFLSAILFAFYHFLPSHLISPYVLSAPILHFLGLVMAGSLYGYIFIWKRFEFVVIFHTLIVFVPFLATRLQ